MYEAGGWVLRESAIADLPTDLRWLFESGAVTLDQLLALHRDLSVVTAADLAAAIEAEAIRRVPGLGPLSEYIVAAALLDLRNPVARIPLGRATAMVDPILSRLSEMPGVKWA